MKSKVLFVIALLMCCSTLANADRQPSPDPARPWMTGESSNMPVKPANPNPVMPMNISDEHGKPLPKVINEDEPITVMANSDIFFDETPTSSLTSNCTFNGARWLAKPKALWFLNDWTKKTKSSVTTTYEIAPNQMVVVPRTPCNRGAISCFTSRKMIYVRDEDGKKIVCFAASSDMRRIVVKDITPPTCGLEISVTDGGTGKCWAAENPPDHFPLPKTADVCFSGTLFNAPDEPKVVEGFGLGMDMIVSDEEAISLKKTDVIKVRVIGGDNYKLDNEKIRFGVCAAAGGEPTSVSPENAEEIDFTKFLIPEKPYLFLDASDVAGNRQTLFIPLKFE